MSIPWNYLCACDMISSWYVDVYVTILILLWYLEVFATIGVYLIFDNFSILCGFGYFCYNLYFRFGMVHYIFLTLIIVIKISSPLPRWLATYWDSYNSPLIFQSLKFSGWWQWVKEDITLEILWKMQGAGIMNKGSFGDFSSNYFNSKTLVALV